MRSTNRLTLTVLGGAIALSASAACSSRASTAATSIQADRRITVSGSADVRVPPNEVVISLGVETWESTLGPAKARNDERVRRVLAIGPRFGIMASDIQTDYINVQPTTHTPDNTHIPQITGYTVRKNIVVTLKDVARFEDVLTAALDAGANYVHGVDFRTTELRQHRDQARAMATKAAKEKAEALAKELGASIRTVVNIREDSFGWRYPYGNYWGSQSSNLSQNVVQNAGGGNPGAESGTISLGLITVSASVSVAFELE